MIKNPNQNPSKPIPKDTGKNKLNRKHKYFVCSMIAEGYSDQLIVQELSDIYNVKCTPDNIRDAYRYTTKWRPIIAKMQERIREKILDHPLAMKAVRLNYIQKGINQALKWYTASETIDKDGNVKKRYSKKQLGVVAALLREARIEIEGDKPVVVINNDNRRTIMQTIHHNYEKNEKLEDEEHSGNDTKTRLTIA